jgi:hypothetical protein
MQFRLGRRNENQRNCLEAQDDRYFSDGSPGKGKEIVGRPCQWMVTELSTNCKIGKF